MSAPLDHDQLPAIASAPLPATYEAARRALEQCYQLDECLMWANKAEALASYARQSHDDALRRMADRIQARAIRRCGELLQQIEPAKTGPKPELKDGAVPQLGRTEAADDAGLSERQRKTALRVANIPEAEFETAIESDKPPTVSSLAERGTVKRPVPDYLNGRDPDDFKRATHLIGLGTYITGHIAEIDLVAARRGLDAAEREQVITTFGQCIDWLTAARRFVIDGL
jgi:hypothetical protein